MSFAPSFKSSQFFFALTTSALLSTAGLRAQMAVTGSVAPVAPVVPTAAPLPAVTAEVVGGAERVAKPEPVNEREVITRLQIFLDQHNFGPGKIDGSWGEFTGKALAAYAKANGLVADATIYEKLNLAELHPIYTEYTIKPEDLSWVGKTAGKPSEQAKLKKLLYGDLIEFLEERFHTDPDFLARLNKGMKLESLKAGDVVRVPNVAPFEIENIKEIAHLPLVPEYKTRQIVINRKERMLTLSESDHIIAAFPITPGSDQTPTPPGNWHIIGITTWPTFRWDEGVLNHGVRTSNFFMLPAGPNNPVGVAWIAVSKPGIGIHGTNNPNTIGRAHSHGCMRMANWDAARFAHMVTVDTKVQIQ